MLFQMSLKMQVVMLNKLISSLKQLVLLTLFMIFCWTGFAVPAQATVSLDGYFIANQACDATTSIKKATNPGNVKLLPDMAYKVIGKNQEEASHYLIRLKDVSPSDRWIPVQCGKLLTECNGSAVPPASPAFPTLPANPSQTECQNPCPNQSQNQSQKDYLLALSWQPAFCQTHQQKTECRDENETQLSARNFSLHGLWPQPRCKEYCCVSEANKKLDKDRKWSELPPVDLSNEDLAALAVHMPGVASNLERHEWYKHGTCYGTSAGEYFQEAVALLNQINQSSVETLFANNIGKTLSARQIREAFDQSFGAGSSSRVQIKCDKTGLLTELWINLQGEIELDTPISSLIEAAPSASAGCDGGIVDRAGI
jgi:ribonuclease T2